ncbi:hypothetical protein ACWEQ1_27405 [Streptomyces nodosus]
MASSDERSVMRGAEQVRPSRVPSGQSPVVRSVSVSAAVVLVSAAIAAGTVACTSAERPGRAQAAASSAAAYASRAAASAAALASELPSPGQTKVFADASALQSAAASLATSHPSSVAVASSLKARASEFDASVSAEVEKGRASAQDRLKSVSGAGNAVGEVSVKGLPNSTSPGKRMALVTVKNRTGRTASYAVQIDFTDSSGKSVDTRFVSVPDVAPGKTLTALAASTSAPDSAPKLAKAERY